MVQDAQPVVPVPMHLGFRIYLGRRPCANGLLTQILFDGDSQQLARRLHCMGQDSTVPMGMMVITTQTAALLLAVIIPENFTPTMGFVFKVGSRGNPFLRFGM